MRVLYGFDRRFQVYHKNRSRFGRYSCSGEAKNWVFSKSVVCVALWSSSHSHLVHVVAHRIPNVAPDISASPR
jgi:hypothetical protein